MHYWITILFYQTKDNKRKTLFYIGSKVCVHLIIKIQGTYYINFEIDNKSLQVYENK